MVTATEATGAAGAAISRATESATKLSGDFNFFLKMLTTQLKNQDPTSPMDVSQMTSQIAQYSGVEQQVQTNANLEKLLSGQRQGQLSTAVSYIGKEVETKGNTGQLAGGYAVFSYILPRDAESAEVVIKNASGSVVFRGQGTKKSGSNLVVWDGKSSSNGQTQADGIYTVEVKAKDIAGKEIKAETRSVALVQSVENDATGNVIMGSGKQKFKFDDILTVRTPTQANVRS
jgi:flagellar basal-body rod modification protein FlgD